MLIAISGAVAGFFHVLSGPDHLAAVGPLALSGHRRSWLVGWTWGIGHASGVVAVAILAILLREQLPSFDAISEWGERVVGGALVVLGVWALRRSADVHAAHHAHGEASHGHLHVHAGPLWFRRIGHAHAAFYLGILHGIAGSSHFLGVLPALALPSQRAALTYIAAFGIGTVVAMTGFAAAVAKAAVRTRRSAGTHRLAMRAMAAIAIAVGGWWLIGT